MESETDKKDFLLAQYSAVSDQVIHWDTFFWSKSQFFLAVEGVAMLGIGNWLVEQTQAPSGSPQAAAGATVVGFGWEPPVMLGAAALLNLFLCIVWLRTGTRNREFLNMRFEIGRAMEERLSISPGLYTYQHWKVRSGKLAGRQSHHLEILMPAAFGVLWLGLLGYLIAAYTPARTVGLNSTLWLALALLIPLVLLVVFCANEVRRSFVTPLPEEGGQSGVWAEFERYCNEKRPV